MSDTQLSYLLSNIFIATSLVVTDPIPRLAAIVIAILWLLYPRTLRKDKP